MSGRPGAPRSRRPLCALLAGALALLALTGCWDYRSTNDMTIVTGVGVDYAGEGEGYRLTFEILDPNHNPSDSPLKGQILTCEGETLFDAVRNANNQMRKKLFFGNIALLVIGRDVAEKEGLHAVLDWFYRDANPRETLHLGISFSDTAAEILEFTEQEDNVLSYEASAALRQNHRDVLSASDFMLYQVHDLLRREGRELTLPLFRVVGEEDEKIKLVEGVAVFKEDRLAGFLAPDDVKSYLLVIDHVEGGLLTMPSPDGAGMLTLEISQSGTSRKVYAEGDRVTVELDISTEVFLGQVPSNSATPPDKAAALMQEAERFCQNKVEETVAKVQSDYGCDIFGFGDSLRKSDPAAWARLGGDWDEIFPQIEVRVRFNVNLENTGLMR